MPKDKPKQDQRKGLFGLGGQRQRTLDEALGDTGLRRPKKRKSGQGDKDAKPK